MIELDPTETFRQEASDLLDSLEAALLDLGQTPQDGDLIDAAFRALHTIKGSGAMFGFDRVATFTHDFETAFDLIRKGKIAAEPDIISVSLSAKDYIRSLIEDPDATDAIIGEAIVEELQSLIAGGAGANQALGAPSATHETAPPPQVPKAGWSRSPSSRMSCATAVIPWSCLTICVRSAPARSPPILAPCRSWRRSIRRPA